MKNSQMVIDMRVDMSKGKLMDKESIIGKMVPYIVVTLLRVIEKEEGC